MKNSNIRQIYGIDILKIVTYVTIEEVFYAIWKRRLLGTKKGFKSKELNP